MIPLFNAQSGRGRGMVCILYNFGERIVPIFSFARFGERSRLRILYVRPLLSTLPNALLKSLSIRLISWFSLVALDMISLGRAMGVWVPLFLTKPY